MIASGAMRSVLDGRAREAIARAADLLAAGEIVAFPTETVYGLGADALQDGAVARIFDAKGRPPDHPLIVHIAAGASRERGEQSAAGSALADLLTDSLARFAQPMPDFAHRLIDAFWPGPLTLILARRPGVADAAAGGQPTIGLRCPAHPVAQALLEACAERGISGLAAPSANRFGRISPTTAEHVVREFGAGVPVLDGGPCEVGIESTIVDCSRGVPVLLRPGAITRDQIVAAGGQPIDDALIPSAPRASGTLAAHYAPNARVRLMDARALQTALDVLGAKAANIAVWSRTVLKSPSQRIVQRRMPDDPAAAAHQLFAVLREFDNQDVKLIWVESLPDGADWEGVRDRLQRAAAAG